jgi:hypothetical protein
VNCPSPPGSPGNLSFPCPASTRLWAGCATRLRFAFASRVPCSGRALPWGLPGWNRARSIFDRPSFWCTSETRPRPAGCPSGLRLNRPLLGPGWVGWPQVPTRQCLLEHHPAFAPLLGGFAPQADQVAADDCVDSRLLSRSCHPPVPGGDTLPGHGTAVEDWDRPRDPRVSREPRVPLPRPIPLRAPLPLPDYPFAGHYGFDPSRSSGPSLSHLGLSYLLPRRPTQPSTP